MASCRDVRGYLLSEVCVFCSTGPLLVDKHEQIGVYAPGEAFLCANDYPFYVHA